jgi:enterochelin esterase-like enzyme
MKNRLQRSGLVIVVCSILLIASAVSVWAQAGPRIEISFPSATHADPITGRVFVMISRSSSREPRFQVGSWGEQTPFFGADVDQLRPNQAAIIDAGTPGYPADSLKDIPVDDYYVQALLNIYTRFSRADGHVIWAHNDQWEGQQFDRSPGNLFSEVQKVHLDPTAGYNLKLHLTRVVPPIEVPPDTEWVKRIKFESKLLSKFWGQPMYLGATILLPKGYDSHPDTRYPVVYYQDHFGIGAPLGFRPETVTPGQETARSSFYRKWISEDYPRLIVVSFQHPTPYFDDSYAVNSANNGPYGDAIMTELIPYLEEHFRIIRKPYARLLTGGSTGGWESLALQVYHPDFFGGTWTLFPDPVDFRRYQLVNIYSDGNAFQPPGFQWMIPERPMMRSVEGQILQTMRQMSQLEEVLGSRGRSGQQYEAWEAVYGPVGEDGYPKPLWDKRTGRIDRDVALYMRDHGYDLRYYIESKWKEIGPMLVGKLHFYCGDMDNFYLNSSLYMLEDFLKKTDNPAYGGYFEWGRPMKGHGWISMPMPDLLNLMAEHARENAPAEDDSSAWQYK